VSGRERLLDQIALVEALAHHVRASTEKSLAEAMLIRLARRLTENGRLSDADALRQAGREAILALLGTQDRPGPEGGKPNE